MLCVIICLAVMAAIAAAGCIALARLDDDVEEE